MDNPRQEKVAVVEEVTAKLNAADAVIITEYRGLSVGQLADLRRQLPSGRWRVQGLQEHARPLRRAERRRQRPRQLADGAQWHDLHPRRCRRRGQVVA